MLLIMAQRRWSESGFFLLPSYFFQTSCGVKMAVVVLSYMVQGLSTSGKNFCICPKSLSKSLIFSDWVMCLSPIILKEMRCANWFRPIRTYPWNWRWVNPVQINGLRIELGWFPKAYLEYGCWLAEITDVAHKHKHLLHFYFITGSLLVLYIHYFM